MDLFDQLDDELSVGTDSSTEWDLELNGDYEIDPEYPTNKEEFDPLRPDIEELETDLEEHEEEILVSVRPSVS